MNRLEVEQMRKRSHLNTRDFIKESLKSLNISPIRNPTLTKEQVKQAIYSDISKKYNVSLEFFNSVWSKVDATGIVDKVIEKASPKTREYANNSLEELEAMVSDDSVKNNAIALEMIKRPNFNRDLVNAIYNGLGVEVKMGAEGTYGKGIQLKRQLNLQQFYTSSNVSKVIADILNVGRALRDSGFGGYRFFESAKGQGFEYDSEKDPRKRHQHGVKPEYHSYYSNVEYTELWIPFLSLNPIFSLNQFFSKSLDPMGTDLGKNHQYITDINVAMDTFINRIFANQPEYFKITNDTMKHGKPLFFFNLVAWEKLSGNNYGLDQRKQKLTRLLGEDAMSLVNTTSKWERTND